MRESGGARTHLQRFETVEGFLAVAEPYLIRREAEHNLLFGITWSLLTVPHLYADPPYLAVVSRGSTVVGAAIQAPPWEIALSLMDDPQAVDLIVADRLGATSLPDLTGATGPVAEVDEFATGWSARTGGRAHLAMRERGFRLDQVVLPRRAPGRMRPARLADRDLVYEWLVDFTDEALHGHTPTDLAGVVDRWLSGAGRSLKLWIDNGLPVSLTGVGSLTPHGTRIGPVYTPSDLRGRGYASNLVASASAWALDQGARFCFLFTDLANPTSNHIYQELGYEPVIDVDRWAFEPS